MSGNRVQVFLASFDGQSSAKLTGDELLIDDVLRLLAAAGWKYDGLAREWVRCRQADTVSP